ncbi:hypothetical protein BS17DRAFT_790026 [Gyrodon lividus]|nr:hypothetical protein BS17DRAFT_790026 [Gyrodon lividus]
MCLFSSSSSVIPVCCLENFSLLWIDLILLLLENWHVVLAHRDVSERYLRRGGKEGCYGGHSRWKWKTLRYGSRSTI